MLATHAAASPAAALLVSADAASSVAVALALPTVVICTCQKAGYPAVSMLPTHAAASPALPVSADAASSVAVALALHTVATVVSSVTVAAARSDIFSIAAMLRQLFLPQLRCFVALMTLAAFFGCCCRLHASCCFRCHVDTLLGQENEVVRGTRVCVFKHNRH